jgi:hypothetical protein
LFIISNLIMVSRSLHWTGNFSGKDRFPFHPGSSPYTLYWWYILYQNLSALGMYEDK